MYGLTAGRNGDKKIKKVVAIKNESRLSSRSMYVCLCQAVRDAEVRQAVASGVEDVEQLAEELGVGTGCGSCREFAQTLIDEYASQPALYHAA